MTTDLPAGRWAAAVCQKGHFIDRRLNLEGWFTVGSQPGPSPVSEVARFCPVCGTGVVVQCPRCGAPLLGASKGGRSLAAATPDPFCFRCGAPFPWTSREARLGQLQHYIEAQDVDEVVKLEAREQLAVLAKPPSETNDAEAIEAAGKFARLVPGVIELGKPVLQQLMIAGGRKIMNLD